MVGPEDTFGRRETDNSADIQDVLLPDDTTVGTPRPKERTHYSRHDITPQDWIAIRALSWNVLQLEVIAALQAERGAPLSMKKIMEIAGRKSQGALIRSINNVFEHEGAPYRMYTTKQYRKGTGPSEHNIFRVEKK